MGWMGQVWGRGGCGWGPTVSEKPQGSCRVVFLEPLVAVGCYMWGVGRGCREERGTLKALGPGLWLSLQRCLF